MKRWLTIAGTSLALMGFISTEALAETFGARHSSTLGTATFLASTPSTDRPEAPSVRVALQQSGTQQLSQDEVDEITYWVQVIWAYIEEYNSFPGFDVFMKLPPRIKAGILDVILGFQFSPFDGFNQFSFMGGVEHVLPQQSGSNYTFFLQGMAGLVRVFESNGLAIQPGAGVLIPYKDWTIRISGGLTIYKFDGGTDTGIRVGVGLQLPNRR